MSELIQRMPMVRPLRGREDFARLQAAAAKDGHDVFFPSHVVEKGGEVAGYLGVCSMPLLRMWMNTELIGAREAVGLINFAENLMRAQGIEAAAGLIGRQSPMLPYVGELGWKAIGETILHAKDLKI